MGLMVMLGSGFGMQIWHAGYDRFSEIWRWRSEDCSHRAIHKKRGDREEREKMSRFLYYHEEREMMIWFLYYHEGRGMMIWFLYYHEETTLLVSLVSIWF